jgi:NAD(P)-dependent dehydrogenase (short-subunit alcohol dehydrogenase family)
MPELLDRLGLRDRVAFITGAAHGIGRATALELSAGGAAVVIADIDPAAASEVAARIEDSGGRATAAELDIANEPAVDKAIGTALSEFGRIDILVNNAGFGARMPTVALETDAWRRVLAVGLDGAFLCSRSVGRHMIERGAGVIVNVSSIMGLSGGGLYPNLAYHAAKGALVSMTRALALEWAPHGIRVNAVAPTFARTRLTESLLSDAAMQTAILDATPLGRLVEPEEVAFAIRFLVSDAAAMITGHTLPVDGGWLAR